MTLYTVCHVDAGELEPTHDVTTVIAQLNINKHNYRYVRVTHNGRVTGYLMFPENKTATYKDFR